MTKRDPHPDNELIDQLQEEGGVADGGTAGGNLQRDIGTRVELSSSVGDQRSIGAQAQDHPQAMNEAKGEKTIARLQPGNGNQGGNG